MEQKDQTCVEAGAAREVSRQGREVEADAGAALLLQGGTCFSSTLRKAEREAAVHPASVGEEHHVHWPVAQRGG